MYKCCNLIFTGYNMQYLKFGPIGTELELNRSSQALNFSTYIQREKGINDNDK